MVVKTSQRSCSPIVHADNKQKEKQFLIQSILTMVMKSQGADINHAGRDGHNDASNYRSLTPSTFYRLAAPVNDLLA